MTAGCKLRNKNTIILHQNGSVDGAIATLGGRHGSSIKQPGVGDVTIVISTHVYRCT
jgi:hypothetical protein